MKLAKESRFRLSLAVPILAGNGSELTYLYLSPQGVHDGREETQTCMVKHILRPGIEQTRLMSRTLNVRKAEWDLIRGNHQGQRQLRCIKQAGHKTIPDLMSKLQKILAMQEPSTQDIGCTRALCAVPVVTRLKSVRERLL